MRKASTSSTRLTRYPCTRVRCLMHFCINGRILSGISSPSLILTSSHLSRSDGGSRSLAGNLKQKKGPGSLMNEHLRLLSRAFPGLKKLHLSFVDGMYHSRARPDAVMDEIDHTLLDPLGSILKRATHLNEYTVDLPTNMFHPLSRRALKAGDEIVKRKFLADRKFWQLVTSNGSDAEVCNYGGIWIAAGEESDFDFDWQGSPFRLSARPSILL